MIYHILGTKNILDNLKSTSEVVLNIFNKKHAEKILFYLQVLPEKTDQIFNWLKINKVDLLQDSRFEFFFIPKISLIPDSFFSDDDTISHGVRRSFRFLKISSFFITMPEGVSPEQRSMRFVRLEDKHLSGNKKNITTNYKSLK